MSETTLGREPIQIVEIEQPTCANTYGDAPCTAIAQTDDFKCFNTRATCQDVSNYDQSTSINLRFTNQRSNLPTDNYYLPFLLNASTSPTIINTGATGKDYKPLGVRSTLTVNFDDAPHTDKIVDPYLSGRNYNPLNFSTFWNKWIKRNPYSKGWNIKIYEGYVGETLANMKARSYIIEQIDTNSKGKITVKAKDPLTLADDDKVTVPTVSEGILIADITNAETTIRITGADAADYPAPNYVRIGDEVIYYATVSTISATEINLNSCTRGNFNTVAESHGSEDSVQICRYIDNENVVDVTNGFLINDAGINTSLINTADWEAERDTWLNIYDVSALITEPTGVTKLLGELSQQCTFNIWWDERAQKIKLRALKPSITTVKTLTDDKNILADSISIKRKEKERYSQVWMFFGQKDPTKSITETSNYTNLRINADLDAETAEKYGQASIKKIYSRWLVNNTQATLTNNRVLSQFKDTPEYITLSVDAKDRDIWTGELIDLSTSHVIDNYGNPNQQRCQIISSNESESGHKIKYTLLKFPFDGTIALIGNGVLDGAESDANKEKYGFICSDTGFMSDGTTIGYKAQ